MSMHPAPYEPRGAHTLAQRVAAEGLGTMLLVLAVVGSGIAAQRLSPNQIGLELLENAVATGAALVAVILALGPISGAHLNPVVSLVDTVLGDLHPRQLAVYVPAQLGGGALGAVLANMMYGLPAVSLSQHTRGGGGVLLAEVVATFGLLLVIAGVTRAGRGGAAPFAVGAYITGAYFFTSSTSFANPAVAVARTLTNSFAGIAPSSLAGFVAAQLGGMVLAGATIALLWPRRRA